MALTRRNSHRKYNSGSSFMPPTSTSDKATELLGGVASMMPGVNGKIASIGNTAANAVGGLMKDKSLGEGVSVATNGEAALTGGIKAASSGFALGNTIVPGLGGIVGGAAGLVGGALGGFFSNQRKQKEAQKMATNLYNQRVDRTMDQSAQAMGAGYAANYHNYVPMGAKGMKLNLKASDRKPKFAKGGTGPKPDLKQQAYDAGAKALDLLDVPQKEMMQLFTGKEQKPSDWLNSKGLIHPNNPIERGVGLAADVVADPMNLLPVAKLKYLKTLAGYVPDAANTMKMVYNTAKRTTDVAGTASDVSQTLGASKTAKKAVRTFRAGGKATVLGGQNHSEGNEEYGNGNPIVGGNEKMAETEREELVMDAVQTKAVEDLVYSLTGGHTDLAIYAKLGTLVEGIILHETEDNSGKFKELNNGAKTKQ